MISAVVLTKNEENNIVACLRTLRFCDDIIVIDDNSIDATVDFAKQEHAKVISHTLNEDFSIARNLGLSHAKNDWVLFVDADERVTDDLAQEIQKVVSDLHQHNHGFFIKRKDFLWGRELRFGETGNIKLLRLAKKNSGKWERKVHEVWDVKGQTGTLTHSLYHYPHPTIAEFLRDINFYTTLRAEELFEQKKSVSWFFILLYPKAKFFQNYIIKLGFLDGIPGFLHAVLMSFHSFLVRSKLWLLYQNE